MPRVSLAETSKVFEVTEGSVIYDALSDQGERLPHGCLSGSCGACRVHVISGKDHLSDPSVIELNTIESLKQEFAKQPHMNHLVNFDLRLACRAKVKGDCEIKPV